MLILSIAYLSLTPHPVQLPVEHSDKYGHIVAYATLMFWYALIYPRPRERTELAVAFVFMGVGLEFLQRLTGYRTFDVVDMAADTIGIGVGWLVAMPHWAHFPKPHGSRR